MKLYADRPIRATNQVLGDLLVLGWTALWVWAGFRLHDLVMGLAAPGKQAEKAGRTLQHSLGDAAGNVGDVPFAGDALRAPFDEGSGAGRDLADAARSYQEAVGHLALLAGVLIALAPIVVVLVLWLPRRVGWITSASAAQRLLRGGGDHGTDLFALRALAARPLPELARTSRRTGDLMEGWRQRDPEVVASLARLELDELGLRPPAMPASSAAAG
ncbi:MAG: hypothetical protein ABJA93_06495 [Sporichthyaceae bacterium]